MSKRNATEDSADGRVTPGEDIQDISSPNINAEESNLIRPFVMQFHITFTKLTMSAALLPSLLAGKIYLQTGFPAGPPTGSPNLCKY